MLWRQAFNFVKLILVTADVPLPSLYDSIAGVIQDPDQVIPVVVGRFGHPGNVASRLAARSIAFDLVALAVEVEVVALLDRGGADHGLRVFVLAHPDEHRCVVLREHASYGWCISESLLPAQRSGDEVGSERGVHVCARRRVWI